MDPTAMLSGFDAALAARRVFGEPIERDGVILVPAARIGGGGGGGIGAAAGRERPEGSGLGFGLSARPAGAFVLDRGRLRWKPAIDVNRIILGGQLIVLAALWTLQTYLKAQPAPPRRPLLRRLSRRAR